MLFSALLALASGAAAQSRGFNYGSLASDGSARTVQDFTDQFNAAKALQNTNGEFTSARLFTMIQAGTTSDVTTAIQAAIDTDTSLLLGLWGSGGQDGFNAELGALKSAIDSHGSDFTSRVVGISVGSEDLYRISPTGIENNSGAGAGPDTISSYVGQLRQLISGTGLSKAPVGHVDTWTAWVNGSNSAVIEAVDFIGLDAYPYFQNTEANGIDNGESLFFNAYDATIGVASGKPVWVTETGWPVQGATSGSAVASTSNAETYWKAVSCRLQSMGANLWWFTLDEPLSNGVSFNIANPSNLLGQPEYDLSCSGAPTTSGGSSSSTTASSTVMSSMTSSSMSTSSVASTSIPLGVLPPVKVSSSSSSSSSPSPATTTAMSSSSSASSLETVVVTTAAPGTAGGAPELVTQTSVVMAPAETTAAGTSSGSASAQSSTPLAYAGGAARVAGGAAAGLAGVVAFLL